MDKKNSLVFKIGYLYEVHFKDHSAGLKSSVGCKAVGYVIDDHEDYVHFSCWVVKTDDLDIFHSNLESFVVLKSCIESRRILCQKTKKK